MAVIERFETTRGVVIFCKITMSAAALRECVTLTPLEESYLQTLATEKRRREWLAWHVVLQKYIEGDTSTIYNAAGIPTLANSQSHISVSHHSDYVALYHSSHPCGVDLDFRGRDFTKVLRRIASPTELAIAGDMPLNDFLSLVWCTKEAIYKRTQHEGLDFVRDIEILEISTDSIRARAKEDEIELAYKVHENHNIVYTK